MPDHERPAEIEAVARALHEDEGGEGEPHWRHRITAEKVIAALDRVRDARGDDEAHERVAHERVVAHFLPGGPAARSPQGEDHEIRRDISRNAPLRERIADELAHNDECGSGPVSWQEYLADADAILRIVAESSPSRDGSVAVRHCRDCDATEGAKHDRMCSLVSIDHPLVTAEDCARDGTVAVEDVRAQTIAEVVTWLRQRAPYAWHDDNIVADAIEREFSPASTGDREENDEGRH